MKYSAEKRNTVQISWQVIVWFLVQFEKNIHFTYTSIALVLRTRAIVIVFEKVTCTRNHPITYTYRELVVKITDPY
jgi:hypothetical protein